MTNPAKNDTPTAMEIIRDLITSGSGRSLAGQIRETFDEIEAAIAEGYSLKVITESLNAKGVKVTYKYMKNMRLRIRKERQKAKIREPTQQSAPGAAPHRPVFDAPPPQSARQRREALGKKYAPDESPASKNPLL